nr:MAG TPA: hypothetical protein [Caudoviricetes sp.]
MPLSYRARVPTSRFCCKITYSVILVPIKHKNRPGS